MFKYGLAILLFGIVIPATVSHIARWIGSFGAIVFAFALGLAYGAVKSADTWSGEASAKALTFALACAFIPAAYTALCLGVARLVARKSA